MHPTSTEAVPVRRPAAVLAEAARAIHGERDLEALLEWVAGAATAAVAADAAGVLVLGSNDREALWRVSGPKADRLAYVDVGLLGPLRPAIVGDDAVTVDHVAGFGRLLAVPILDGTTRTVGCIIAATDDAGDGRFDASDEGALVALGAHLGVALENHTTLQRLAGLEASRREVVHQLQEAVRPPRPAVPYTELGVHYVASDPSAPTGGDLYDWVVLPNGDLHLAVVDIMGKGVAATKDALAVTHALRLLVLDGCPLEGVVARADAIVTAQNPELVATLIVANYTPSTGRLQIVGGGHPPPLLVAADGTVRELPAPGIPIGWPGAGSHEVVTVQLDRSDTLIIYTDGLVETSKDIVAGLAQLAELAQQTVEYPATHQARILVERILAGVPRHDDSLALVLRRRIPPASSGAQPLGPFEYRFTPSPATVPLARHFLREWLTRLPAEPAEADDLLLVATELCGNAVRHASGAPGSVSLRARAENADVVVEVEDDGRGLDLADSRDELPDPEAESGRGLFLVSALVDELSVERTRGRTVVRCVRRAVIPARDQA